MNKVVHDIDSGKLILKFLLQFLYQIQFGSKVDLTGLKV